MISVDCILAILIQISCIMTNWAEHRKFRMFRLLPTLLIVLSNMYNGYNCRSGGPNSQLERVVAEVWKMELPYKNQNTTAD